MPLCSDKMCSRHDVGIKVVSIRVHKVKAREKQRKIRYLNKKLVKGFAFALILFVTACTTEGSIPPRVCGRDRSDGPVFYDVTKSICCDGTVHPLLTNGSEYGCCTRKDFDGHETQQIYDTGVYLCCGSHLVPLYDGWKERNCCKGDDEKQFPGKILEEGFVCCNGRTYKLEENENCCGTMKYDASKHLCCNDYGGPSLQEHNAKFASPACCGNQTYDEETHWCDYSPLPPIVRSLQISECKGQLYDTGTHVCCDDEEGPLLKKPVPDSWYSQPREYICCNNTLIDKHEDEKICCPAIPEKNIVEHSIQQGDICCGNGSVKNSPLERCCNGVANRIVTHVPGEPWEPHKCCGTKYVKDGRCCNGREMTLEYACCGGTVVYSRNSALDCCGGDVYDTNQQVCCTRSSAIKFTIDKDRVDDTDCCMPAKVPYNRHTHNCTQSGVLEKPETRDATILACPYCRRKAQPSSYCRARNVYEISVRRVKFTDKGSHLYALVKRKRTTIPIKIIIPYRCPACIRENTGYLVFTNRKIKHRELKLKSKSMFFKKDEYSLKQVKRVCDVDKKIRRTVKKLARGAVKKTVE